MKSIVFRGFWVPLGAKSPMDKLLGMFLEQANILINFTVQSHRYNDKLISPSKIKFFLWWPHSLFLTRLSFVFDLSNIFKMAVFPSGREKLDT